MIFGLENYKGISLTYLFDRNYRFRWFRVVTLSFQANTSIASKREFLFKENALYLLRFVKSLRSPNRF